MRRALTFLAWSASLCAQPAFVPPALNQAWPDFVGFTLNSPSHRWYRHMMEDLMPFWNNPEALGSPVGNFPTLRCDDRSSVDFATVTCPEVRQNAWLFNERQRYLVAQSRQIYAYGVIFHMTGNAGFLDYMKAGVDQFRTRFIDRSNGGMFTRQDLRNGAYGPRYEVRNAQELAYGMLGIGFYYYLTRDPEVLPDILWLKSWLWSNYWNDQLGSFQWTIANDGTTSAYQRQLTATLDQMNAYMVLLAPIIPEPYAAEWKADLMRLSRAMIRHFYNESENLMYLSANSPADLDPLRADTDFGHTIKALWMIRFSALMAGDSELVKWAEDRGARVLERAYQPASGSWASGVRRGRVLDLDKSWWIYCELDQYAGTMSLNGLSAANGYLAQTQDYWLRNFVDPQFGEVWSNVNGVTHQPISGTPKQWPWKNGYHSLEHALVGFITSRTSEGGSVPLYFGFAPAAPRRDDVQPYFFRGSLQSADQVGPNVWQVVFRDVK
ncbi:MAG: AGE family epimerase/isomerase [Acidobacteria bacterium]|nr:AGE family epimerase/isomerase [Acidobacteriota bacterium]